MVARAKPSLVVITPAYNVEAWIAGAVARSTGLSDDEPSRAEVVQRLDDDAAAAAQFFDEIGLAPGHAGLPLQREQQFKRPNGLEYGRTELKNVGLGWHSQRDLSYRFRARTAEPACKSKNREAAE